MIKKNFTLIIAATLMALPLPTFAGENQAVKTDDDAKIVEAALPSATADADKVIKEQLEAIRARNDRTAYELNVEDVKNDYEDPQSFMRMIRRDKPSLYDHVSYEIMKSVQPQSAFHKVRLIDRYGDDSIAMFKMKQDEKGAWRIQDIIMLSGGKDPI